MVMKAFLGAKKRSHIGGKKMSSSWRIFIFLGCGIVGIVVIVWNCSPAAPSRTVDNRILRS